MLLSCTAAVMSPMGSGATGRAEKFGGLVKGLYFWGPVEIIMAMSLTCKN